MGFFKYLDINIIDCFSKIVSCTADDYLLGEKHKGRFTADSEYFNIWGFSLLFIMIRREKFYGVWEIISMGECFGWICANPSVLLARQSKSKACTRADAEVTGLFLTLFAHMVKALNLILKYMTVSANDGKFKNPL